MCNTVDDPWAHYAKWNKVKLLSCVWLFVTPWTIQNSPGQNTQVGSLSPLHGIFPTQGSNPGLPHCRQILYQPSHQGSPRILEWVAYPFSSGSSWPRNQPGSPALQVDSLPSKPPGKPKNIGVGSLSLLQWIFLTQESTRVSCIAGRFFTSWATREAQYIFKFLTGIGKMLSNTAFQFKLKQQWRKYLFS